MFYYFSKVEAAFFSFKIFKKTSVGILIVVNSYFTRFYCCYNSCLVSLVV